MSQAKIRGLIGDLNGVGQGRVAHIAVLARIRLAEARSNRWQPNYRRS